ncbi:xanthine dehydrogenase family protein molybdopterin-binding subunit [Mongoliitalea daihaiensis]|uniref:xanthine dehydrogenase family protein molybdopterin-binding subunit n=1 Tax=Mongoliitalea daihaiensis TaxID=2782006 RepID=UPI001F481783|nr:molybdopterin cofactor-binding domain-containing protein [Mongoliitalea daihaiensis]UJP66842.1 xanthine dehydrogenase family protein molybdopterin-binding subunit [Mongoliitalea daihaiensis]
MKLLKTNRRDFLKKSGQLLIGFQLFPLLNCTTKEDELHAIYNGIPERPHLGRELIDSWIRLDSEGHVTVLTGKKELGQGIRTALIQIAADELQVDINRCHIINGDTGQTANEGYTAGSNSIEGSGKAIRQAAAEAKFFLVQLASERLDVPLESLTIKDGSIYAADNRQVSYWELLDGQYYKRHITGNAPILEPAQHQYVGKPIPREDIRQLVQGKAHFVHDLSFPDMVHARVLHPPSYGAQLEELKKDKITALPGISDVLVDGNFVAVIAEREYQAVKAWEKMKVIAVWEKPSIETMPSQLFSDMRKHAQKPEVIRTDPKTISSISNAELRLKASYQKPYHMHASAGPSCALAKWTEEGLTVWSPTQGVYPLRATLSDLFSLDPEKIRCIGVPGSGCYGHNGADDVSAEAAIIAQKYPNKTIRLQWMREDEHQWEPYGSAMILDLEAGISADGYLQAMESNLWSDTHSTRPNGQAGHFVSARHLEKSIPFNKRGFSGGAYRNAIPLYIVPHYNLYLHNYEGPLRTSALRGLGAYANIFALESFIDELASLAGLDPFVFRIQNLQDPRAIAVLEELRDKTNWASRNSQENKGYGIAFSQYKNSAAYFAVLAEVELSSDKKSYTLQKLTGVIDAGQCINPDGLINQTEGGMIQSASWTMMEAVSYDENGILSRDWNSYPIISSKDIPVVEVQIINRPELPPLGAGEAAQGPVAAAIANAVFDCTGTRVRELPIKI